MLLLCGQPAWKRFLGNQVHSWAATASLNVPFLQQRSVTPSLSHTSLNLSISSPPMPYRRTCPNAPHSFPHQSVVDLTSAARPPTRGLDLDTQQQQEVQDAVSVSESDVVQGSALGRRLQDGAGRLADGTRCGDT